MFGIERIVALLLLRWRVPVERHFEAGEIERAARAHVDLAGETGLELIGRARLEHVDAADEIGRDVLQREAAADAGEHIAAVPGGGDCRADRG